MSRYKTNNVTWVSMNQLSMEKGIQLKEQRCIKKTLFHVLRKSRVFFHKSLLLGYRS